MSEDTQSQYGLGDRTEYSCAKEIQINYLPKETVSYQPEIGLIGCGGVTVHHLAAYKKAGYKVTAICDISGDKAKESAQKFFPNAEIYTDYLSLLKNKSIEVVDIATHPEVRKKMLFDSIEYGKNILSQKPFVTDLIDGYKIVEAADKAGVTIAVNQNGRWAPHFSYIRGLLNEGYLGDIIAVHLSVSWNHRWIKDTPFENVKYLLLYDFGIHWFDILSVFFKNKIPLSVFASTSRSPGQNVKPDFISQAVVSYKDAQASVNFQADIEHGQIDRTFIVGTKGTVISEGPDLDKQQVKVTTKDGVSKPELTGSWFKNGFHGTMAELLCAIEEKREPINSARNNLESLKLCFAAVHSAENGNPVVPGSVHNVIL